jgi:hypothetical protein
MISVAHLVGNVLDTSELVSAVKAVKEKRGRSVLFGDNVRFLTKEEIDALKGQGNYAQDWAQIFVSKKFTVRHVFNCNFFGTCVLGSFTAQEIPVAPGVKVPSGIYQSTIINAEIGDNALVMNVGLLANYLVHVEAIVANVQSLCADEKTCFGNGAELSIAIESGGREVLTYAEITVAVAERVAISRRDRALLESYADFVKRYVMVATCSKGIMQRRAIVRNSTSISNTFIGTGAKIDNATLVNNSTILSNEDEKTEISDGAYVVNSLLQWGCEVTSMAIVDTSVLTEHSHVARHGKVTQSIIGPNTGVAEGEVTACLVGPFVGFHHQALLIAAFWPEGKGNVGYGANVGSNHTSKAPDQEIWCGEGTFFGLGTNIKFPSDFTKAPYSIIATAVNALPQRIEFPFSLINSPAAVHPGLSPAFNEIMPGWVLSDNIFTIKRNEGKYMKRNKAKRSTFVFEVFRPDIVDMMIEARSRLQSVKEKKDLYTDKNIRGLGKNYLLEENRVSGIEAYTFYITYYALLGLKKRIAELLARGDKHAAAQVLSTQSDDTRWEHERTILQREIPSNDVAANLKLLSTMQEKIAHDVQSSKEKDDKRGARVIADYADAHPPASEDNFVKETWKATEELKKEVESILAQLSA